MEQQGEVMSVDQKPKSVHFIKFQHLRLNNKIDKETSVSLTWQVRNGYPRIVVYMEKYINGKRADFNINNMITAPFDYVTIRMFMSAMKDITSSEPGTSMSIDCNNIKYVDGKKTDTVYKQATVTVTKHMDGYLTIGVAADDRYSASFDIKASDIWFKFYKNGKVIDDKAALHKVYALSYIQQVENALVRAAQLDGVTYSIVEGKHNNTTPAKPMTSETPTADSSDTDLLDGLF